MPRGLICEVVERGRSPDWRHVRNYEDLDAICVILEAIKNSSNGEEGQELHTKLLHNVREIDRCQRRAVRGISRREWSSDTGEIPQSRVGCMKPRMVFIPYSIVSVLWSQTEWTDCPSICSQHVVHSIIRAYIPQIRFFCCCLNNFVELENTHHKIHPV